MSPPGNYQLRANPFVCTVRRFADGTPSGRALRIVYRTLTVGRDDLGAPVQELPYLSLRGAQRRGNLIGLRAKD